MTTSPPPLTRDVLLLASLFLTSGVSHFVRPQIFEGIVPTALPYRRELVFASGAAELACAAGLLHPATRKAAGLASAGLLLAVFPANLKMAADQADRVQQRPDKAAAKAMLVGSIARLPAQWPLIRTALRAAGRLA